MMDMLLIPPTHVQYRVAVSALPLALNNISRAGDRGIPLVYPILPSKRSKTSPHDKYYNNMLYVLARLDSYD